MIVEKITGNRWAQEIRSRIIEPLDLEDTTFVSEEGVWGGSMVPGFFPTPDGYTSTLDLPSYPTFLNVVGGRRNGGNLSDLLTFANVLFDGRLVSKETLAEMATPLATDPENGAAWGLGGATIDGMPGAFGMEGGIPGYSAFYIGVQDTKLVVAALLNTEEGDVIAPSLMARSILRALPPAGQEPVTPARRRRRR